MDSDPTPGDIDEMNRVRDRYRSIGDQAEVALDFLKKGGQVETGRGEAMDKLRERIDDLPDKLQKTVTSYHDAAEAYTTYGPKLVEAQDLLDKAMDQALDVADQARQSVAPLPDDATDQQKSDAKKQQDQIDRANDSLTAAKDLAQQARSMRETAQRACADVLDRAAGEAIPERNIFQKIADFFKDFPFVQILLGALIAITSVFFPVVGALLGGALFAFTTVVGAASGTLTLGDVLTGLLGIIPGGGLLKLGGKAATALGGVAKSLPGVAKFADGAGGVIGKVSGSITKVGDSLKNSTTLQGVLNHPVTQIGRKAAEDGAEEAAGEAASEVIQGQPLDAGAIAGAGAVGLAGGALGAGAKKSPFPQKGSAAAPSGGTGTRTLPGGGKGRGRTGAGASSGAGPSSGAGASPATPGGTGTRAVPGDNDKPFLTEDQIIKKITGTAGRPNEATDHSGRVPGNEPRRTLGGFPFGDGTLNGAKNIISRPEVLTLKDRQGQDVQVAVHLNATLSTGNEVVTETAAKDRNVPLASTVNIKVSHFHLTARPLSDQNLIDAHGASQATADNSVHLGASNEHRGFDNRDGNIDNLATSLNVDKDDLVKALDDRFGSVTDVGNRFHDDVQQAVLHGSKVPNVTVNIAGDKTFPFRGDRNRQPDEGAGRP
ncbi:hypothetical protein GCM10018793_70510 [Streptomyces sulfonofaciens]|uniref:Uncharacterized protein n=1 Tax=Streptomyces sulfonofaciens TaxID=68272 RepID=A0A919L8U7_9ACTN|nr:hypothetical protein [Streptomyces sulfonofaciens]GHH88960.1 hypothetical protein GCM10018793_70510 [Streptomyces sulfonofaciens]